MKIEYIREFITLAECRNFSEAADRMFTTQSSISKHLSSLEDEIGHKLFIRDTRNVQLNRSGQVFLTYAKDVVEKYDAGVFALNQLEQKRRTSLSVGLITPCRLYRIPDILRRLQNKYPECSFEIVEDSTQNIISKLKSNRCNIAFARGLDLSEDPSIHAMRFATDQLCAVVAPDCPLYIEDKVSLRMLGGYDIFYRGLAPLSGILEQRCKQEKVQLNLRQADVNSSTLLSFYPNAHNISIIMHKTAEYEMTQTDINVKLLNIDPPIYNNMYVYYRPSQLNQYGKELLQYIERMLPDFEERI